ncbi:20310_t:CDS:1, partial [Racocetra persica]
CGECGYYTIDCSLELLLFRDQQRQNYRRSNNTNRHKDINFVEAEYESKIEEEKIYMAQHQLYSTNRKKQKKNKQKH